MEIEALIFDVDGTMAETEELHRRAFNDAFAHFSLGWYWDVDLYRRLLRVTGGKERIAHYLEHDLKGAVKMPLDRIGELHRFKTTRYAEFIASGGCQLRRGVKDLIESSATQGRSLAIATTTSLNNIEALMTPIFGKNWFRLFCAIVSGDETERKKPSPDVYFKVLHLLGLPALSCLALEDSRNGLLAARAAGIPVAVVRSLYFADDDFEGAKQVVDELTELDDYPRLLVDKQVPR